MKIGIQGERGSACDSAAVLLVRAYQPEANFIYFQTAEMTLAALEARSIDAAVLAFESPLGVAVRETAEALAAHAPVTEISELRSEVHHCIMVQPGTQAVHKVASHPVTLEKHQHFLSHRFPGYEAVEVEDTGHAARLLSEGKLSADTAVIAMPHAAELFGLTIIESSLPANEGYLTRFALIKRTEG